MPLPAMVAVTTHVPAPAVIDTEPEEFTVQAVDVPSVHVTVPAVEPPEVESATVAPYDPAAGPLTVRADCVALEAVMSAVAEVAAYVASLAFVTAMLHVPVPTSMSTTPEDAFTEHTPGDVVANTTAPPPLPPAVPRVAEPP